MTVVSNTGPIIALSKIRQLPLLKTIFGNILVPPVVAREVFAKLDNEIEDLERAFSDFIQITEKPILPKEVEIVIRSIDAGEKGAIGLAYNLNALLIIDDNQARNAARKLNLEITGSVGVLLLAKQKKLIPSLKQLMLDIRENGYFYSDELIETAIELANET